MWVEVPGGCSKEFPVEYYIELLSGGTALHLGHEPWNFSFGVLVDPNSHTSVHGEVRVYYRQESDPATRSLDIKHVGE
jgi:hypothetical protein